MRQKQRKKKMRPYIPTYFETLIQICGDEATRFLDVVHDNLSFVYHVPLTEGHKVFGLLVSNFSILEIRGSETKKTTKRSGKKDTT